MKMRILGLTTALILCCTTAFADKVAQKPGIMAIQAELMADMHAHLLKIGSTVFARVTVPWEGANCTLNDGAILEGHVVSVVPHTKTAKGSEVDLAFTKAQCSDLKMGAYDLTLAAMAAPPDNSDLGILGEKMPSAGGGGFAAMTGMENNSNLNLDFEAQVYQFPLVPNMKMGYVAGLKGLTLNAGSGPENSSVLTSKDHDVALEKHTLLLLVPKGAVPVLAAKPSGDASGMARAGQPGALSGSPDTPGAAPAPPPVEDIDLCAPPQCSQALPSGSATDLGKAAATISISQLGFASRPQRVLKSFENDDALAYLGPRELLVAFNPHKLVTRHALGKSGYTVRIIRAATFDTETHQVTHTVDWELPDNRQYLWPLAGGHVLVHVGSELRVYGQGLKIENRITLNGPLAFVRVTPNGNFIAIGEIHESHTPELHAQLTQSLGAEPDEDVRILVLNRSFQTIARSATRSGMMAPTLLNEGQAKLKARPNMRYRISMMTWDNQDRTITQFTSSCTPELSSIAPDLMFLVSCDKQTQGREYRVLRPDGKVVLKGASTLNDCGQAAEGSANQAAFVVKIVQSTLPMPPGAIFSAANFSSEDLGVYRAADGKRLLGVRVGSPTSSRDGYALAPDGSQLAVLTRDEIAVYSVPAK